MRHHDYLLPDHEGRRHVSARAAEVLLRVVSSQHALFCRAAGKSLKQQAYDGHHSDQMTQTMTGNLRQLRFSKCTSWECSLEENVCKRQSKSKQLPFCVAVCASWRQEGGLSPSDVSV